MKRWFKPISLMLVLVFLGTVLPGCPSPVGSESEITVAVSPFEVEPGCEIEITVVVFPPQVTPLEINLPDRLWLTDTDEDGVAVIPLPADEMPQEGGVYEVVVKAPELGIDGSASFTVVPVKPTPPPTKDQTPTPTPVEEAGWWLKPNFLVLSDIVDAVAEGASAVLEYNLTRQRMEEGAQIAHLAGFKYGIFISLHDIEWAERETLEPLLEDAVAIGFDGTPFIGWAGVFYDTNHPLWQEFLVNKMKEAVDAGAEIICIDDNEGNAWFSNRGDEGAIGVFSEYSMQGFREYLTSKYSQEELEKFGVNNLATFDYAAYLKEKGYTKEDIHEQILAKLFYQGFNPIDIPLFEDFQAFQNLSVVNFHEQLITEIKEYGMRTQSKEIIFTAYPWDLFVPENYSFFSHYDLFSPELHYTWRAGFPPKGRAAQWYKLGFAVAGVPGAFKPTDSSADVLPMAEYNTQNLLKIRFAEAYANRGGIIDKPTMVAFTEEAVMIEKEFQTDPETVRGYAKFLRAYDEVLGFGSLESLADVGVVFSLPSLFYDKWAHIDSWEGICDLLAHLHVPYDVIYTGDGIHDGDRIEAENLSKYPVIILPHVLALTEKQENALLDYVNGGGKVVVYGNLGEVNEYQQEVERPSLNAILNDEVNSYGEGKLYYYPSKELGYEYYSYTVYSPIVEEFGEAPDLRVTEARANEIKNEFQELLDELITERQIEGPVPQNVFVQPYLSGDKLYVHLINYDYELQRDEINDQEHISVEIKLPTGFNAQAVKVISPDFEGVKEIEFAIANEYITFTVPRLYIWDVVVIE